MPRTERITFKIFKKPLWTVAICLSALAALSAIGLDLINRAKGEKSHIFAARDTSIRSVSLSSKARPQAKGEDKLTVPQPKGKETENVEADSRKPSELSMEAAEKAKVQLPEPEVKAKTKPSPPPEAEDPIKTEPPAAVVQPAEEESPELKRRKGKVALIVDDMGNSLQAIEDLCRLDLPVTIAILPHSRWAVETALVAQDHGLEVILHLPLESINDHESNEDTEGLIHSEMSEEEILAALEDSLQRVPFIKGVNNHMGSKITAERRFMKPILETLKEKNLFFIDSVTTGRSVAYQLARQLGIPTAERHVFLDNDASEESIRENLIQLFRLAQRRGYAVGICHPFETTIKVLLENLASIREHNCEAVFISQILH